MSQRRNSEELEAHERGEFIHPEDKKKHQHPSSLESFHHIGHDGKPVYSRAQLASLARGKSALEALEKSAEKLSRQPLPAFHEYVLERARSVQPDPGVAIEAHEIEESSVMGELEAAPQTPREGARKPYEPPAMQELTEEEAREKLADGPGAMPERKKKI